MKKETIIEQTILDEIARAITKLNYGEVKIIVHDKRVIQIETKEKKRYV